MTRGLPGWLLGALLMAFGLVSVAFGVVNALRPQQSRDLAPVYRAARLWAAHADPYRPVSREVWREMTGATDVPDDPPRIDASSIYSPIAAMDVAVVTGRSWIVAKRAWLGVNLLLAVYVPVLVWSVWFRDWSPVHRWVAAGLWLGGMGLRIGLGNGQHALLWLACLLTACALMRSRPRVAGVFLALSLHKFNLTAIVGPYFVVRRAGRMLLAGAGATMLALAVFFAWSHAPAAGIASSYASEFGWLFRQSHGGTLPGSGVTDVYSLLAGVAGDGALAGVLTVIAALAGLALTLAVTDRSADRSRDVDVAVWLLLVLWTTYHRSYDTVLFVVPLAVLIDRLWRGREAATSWRRALPVVVLTLMWYVDPVKVYGLFYPVSLEQLPAGGLLAAMQAAYRLGVLAVWMHLVWLAWRERREGLATTTAGRTGASGALAGLEREPDKTSSLVWRERACRAAVFTATTGEIA